MHEWLRQQEWSEELWVAAWVLAVVALTVVAWSYDRFLKH
jgi:hypothetical protein